VDSSDKGVYPRSWLPRSTTASGPTVTYTDGRELASGLSLTIGTKNGVSGTGSINGKVTHAQEVTRNLSRVTALPGATFVKWSYDVDDSYQQQGGLEVEHDRHPFLKFWLRKAHVEKPINVELSGYWVNRITPKKGMKLLSAFRKRQAVPLLRNFCHLTCITLPPHLPRSAISTLQLEARMPCHMAEPVVVKSVEADFELGVEMEGHVELNS
jgi:hypothetical protein